MIEGNMEVSCLMSATNDGSCNSIRLMDSSTYLSFFVNISHDRLLEKVSSDELGFRF